MNEAQLKILKKWVRKSYRRRFMYAGYSPEGEMRQIEYFNALWGVLNKRARGVEPTPEEQEKFPFYMKFDVDVVQEVVRTIKPEKITKPKKKLSLFDPEYLESTVIDEIELGWENGAWLDELMLTYKF